MKHKLQRRMLRRLMLVILVMFGLLIVLTTTITFVSGDRTIAQDAELATGEVASLIDEQMRDLTTDLVRVGISTTVRRYAQRVDATTEMATDTERTALQADVLRAFDDLLNQHGGAILQIAFIAQNGQTWGKIINDGNQYDIVLEVQDSDLTTTPAFRAAFTSARAGEAFLSPVDLETNSFVIYVPITTRGNLVDVLGVIQAEVSLTPFISTIRQSLNNPAVRQDGRRILLLDAANTLLTDLGDDDAVTDDEVVGFLAENPGGLGFQVLAGNNGVLRSLLRDDTAVIAKNVPGFDGLDTPWRVVLVDRYGVLMQTYDRIALGISFIYSLTAILLLGIVALITRTMLSPLGAVATNLRHLAAGTTLEELEPVTKTQVNPDELDVISGTIGDISQFIAELKGSLENQLERQRRDLEVAGRIGREVATVYDIDSVLNRAINMICDGFGFYHAQVFLVDDAGVNVVLAHSRGQVGQQLLAENFSLPVGSETVVGTVAASGQVILINDTHDTGSMPHLANPLLPETRAELGLPLYVGGDVIGVLDIQSKRPGVFAEQDLPTLTLLADQLSVAIQNARLVTETDERIAQIDRLNRQLTRAAWDSSEGREKGTGGYRYNRVAIEPLNGQAPTHQGGVSTPINIRGQVVGELYAAPDAGFDLSDGDQLVLQAVANRVSLALENARLFQETQVSLSETSTLYQLTRALNEANTLAQIVTAIIDTVIDDAAGGQIWLFDEGRQSIVLSQDVALSERRENNEDLAGLRLITDDHPFLRDMSPDRVTLIPNAREDNRLDQGLRLTLRRFGAVAAVFIPITVRGVWRGLITMNFAQPREFSERDGRIYQVLIDQAGVAIDNRLLLRQTEEEVARNENLYAASRIVNTAQNMQDLVYAAVATNSDPDLEFSLSLLEGELDESGWPMQARKVAQSNNGAVEEVDVVFSTATVKESSLLKQKPQVIIDDTPNNDNVPESVKRIRQQGYQFEVTFPLISANQPIALFQVVSKHIKSFDDSDFEVYLALAGQMSSQIQIRKLLERTESALDEARRLYLTSSAITSAQDSQSIYHVAVEHLSRPFEQLVEHTFEIAIYFAMPEPVPDAPTLEYTYGWRSDGTRLDDAFGTKTVSAQDYPYGLVTNQIRTPLYFTDLNNDDAALGAAFRQLRARLKEAGAVSAIAAPIRSRQKWFGVIVCQSSLAGAFDEQYRRFFMATADQVAIAVDNTRLFDEARFEAERAQSEAQRALALAEAAQLTNRIGNTGDIGAGLQQVFGRVAQEAGFNRWMLVLFNEGRTLLQVVTAHIQGFDKSEASTFDLSQQLPLVDAVRLNQTIVMNDLAQYPPLSDEDETVLNEQRLFYGKHIVVPVAVGDRVLGGVYMGRDLEANDLQERDAQLIQTLATQVGLALENRRLFQQARNEQQTLRSILETLPAGVLVLDAYTLLPLQVNQQAQQYFAEEIDPNEPFSVEAYQLYRTGTALPYPKEELPIFTAISTGSAQSCDDLAIISDDMHTDVLMNAAPITDDEGSITSIVVAFQDITHLRSMENTLQENLRETVMMSEAQRQFSEAVSLDDVLDVLMNQLILQQLNDAFILTLDEDDRLTTARMFMQVLEDPSPFGAILQPDRVVELGYETLQEQAPQVGNLLLESNATILFAIPLNVSMRQKPFGWLVALIDELEDIAEEQIRILDQLVDVASTAIDNRLLIAQQEATVKEVQALYNATSSISNAREIDDLTTVLERSVLQMEPDYYAAYLSSALGFSDVEEQVLFSGGAGGDRSMLALQEIVAVEDVPSDGLYIEDLSKLEELRPFEQALMEAGIQSVAAVVLRPRDAAGGVLLVAYDAPHRFGENEMRYMRTLSDAASVKINNSMLFAQIQTALEETSVLYQASRALTDATSTADILDVVVTYLVGPHVDHVFIALLNGNSWEMAGANVQIASCWFDDPDRVDLQGTILSHDQFPAWDLLAADDVTLIDDIQTTELSEEARFGLDSLGARSLALIPLRVPSRAIGAVWISSPEPYHYDDRELRTFQSFAEQASLSMEASYLLQQTERRARQLETSAEVSQSAGRILDLEVLLPQVVDLIQSAFGYHHVQVFLMDDADEFAELRASTGEAGRQLLAIRHKLAKGSDSVIGRVTETGTPQIALDTADATVIHRPNPYLPLTRSEMALPLIIKEKVVGALDVQSNQPNAFNDEDVRALTTLAAQISVAIDNANLYEASQDQALKMGFLFEITSAAASADTLQEALKTVSDHMFEMLGALSTTVYLPQLYVDHYENTYLTLKAVAVAGSEQPLSEIEEIRMDDPNEILAEVALNKQAFVIDNVANEPRYLPVAADAQSVVFLPLMSGNEVIGLIVMEDERLRAYGYELLQLLLTLSGSLSAVVQSMQLLEQLTRTNEQLRELDRLKSDFLANMSHELRTPLNSIIGFSRVMLKGIDGPLTEMQEQDLTTIYNSGQHLLMLINDILDQAKIAADKMDLKTDYFDAKPLVEGVRSIGIGLVKDKPIDIRLEVAPNLPKVYGDEFRTKQVLLNLLSNASKFTNEGSITIQVYPSTHGTTGLSVVRIDVRDTGIGIAEQDLPLLFEAFRQVDSSLTRTVGGTGLGLPIAKSLIELQGGEMLVESQVNVGSVFSITIPLEPAEVEEEGPEDDVIEDTTKVPPVVSESNIMKDIDAPTNPMGYETGDGKETREAQTVNTMVVPVREPKMPVKREVILIEDNKDMVDQFRRILQREGFEVITADHPAYAEAMVSNLRPTLVIMDVNFADGEGWKILERLKDRDDTFDIPIVVVTLSNESERAYQLGAHSFVQRPFMPEDLLESVLFAEAESNKERILIIDDQPSDVRLLTQLLQENGTYRVFSANSGREGVSLVARRRPDLIILDLRMPEMDGFAVLSELHSNPETAKIPVLIVTGELNLDAAEQQKLANVHVLRKTDISQEEYEAFIADVRQHLDLDGS